MVVQRKGKILINYNFHFLLILLYILEIQGVKKVSATTLLLMIVPHLLTTESENKSKKQTCSSRTLMSKKKGLPFLHTTERKVHW